MPSKKSKKKPVSKQKKLVSAKKPASKSKKIASKKKAASRSKKVASAKKTAGKQKKLAAVKKTASKSKKVSVKKKPAGERMKPVIPRQAPEVLPKESGFIDAGLLETEIYEPDPEIREEFAMAAVLGDSSRKILLDELRENAPAESPVVSGGDIDAAWDQSDASGEETVGGSNPTPDQDVVDELGKAVGLIYQDNEPLDTTEKVTERDRHRWELDPESSEDFDERSKR